MYKGTSLGIIVSGLRVPLFGGTRSQSSLLVVIYIWRFLVSRTFFSLEPIFYVPIFGSSWFLEPF